MGIMVFFRGSGGVPNAPGGGNLAAHQRIQGLAWANPQGVPLHPVCNEGGLEKEVDLNIF